MLLTAARKFVGLPDMGRDTKGEERVEKRGPGRPRIENKREKKEGLYGFRTTADEREVLDAAIKIAGEGPSDFAKKSALERARRILKRARAAE
jgi:hypothetical protein